MENELPDKAFGMNLTLSEAQAACDAAGRAYDRALNAFLDLCYDQYLLNVNQLGKEKAWTIFINHIRPRVTLTCFQRCEMTCGNNADTLKRCIQQQCADIPSIPATPISRDVKAS